MTHEREQQQANNGVMPALVWRGAGQGLALVKRPIPHLVGGDEVLVGIAATGICGTDRGILVGSFPAVPGVILGHEAVGHVVAVGDAVRELRPGDPVVINPTFYCGRCQPCQRGRKAFCLAKDGHEIGVDCDGTLAGYLRLSEPFVHRLPDGLSLRRAVQVEPLACVLNNLSAANPQPGDRVLVLGGGPIGALCALVLATRAMRVAVCERDPTRLALARERLPAGVALFASSMDARAFAADVIIDAVGTLLEDAVDLVADGGTVVVMGEQEGATARLRLRPIATRGIRIVGAGPYAPATFERSLHLAPALPLEGLITDVLPLSEYAEAFGKLGVGGSSGAGYRALKVLLVSDEGAL